MKLRICLPTKQQKNESYKNTENLGNKVVFLLFNKHHLTYLIKMD